MQEYKVKRKQNYKNQYLGKPFVMTNLGIYGTFEICNEKIGKFNEIFYVIRGEG